MTSSPRSSSSAGTLARMRPFRMTRLVPAKLRWGHRLSLLRLSASQESYSKHHVPPPTPITPPPPELRHIYVRCEQDALHSASPSLPLSPALTRAYPLLTSVNDPPSFLHLTWFLPWPQLTFPSSPLPLRAPSSTTALWGSRNCSVGCLDSSPGSGLGRLPTHWEAFTPMLLRPSFVKCVMVILVKSTSLVPSVSTRAKRSTEGDRARGVCTKPSGAAVTWSASLSIAWTGMSESVRRIYEGGDERDGLICWKPTHAFQGWSMVSGRTRRPAYSG